MCGEIAVHDTDMLAHGAAFVGLQLRVARMGQEVLLAWSQEHEPGNKLEREVVSQQCVCVSSILILIHT